MACHHRRAMDEIWKSRSDWIAKRVQPDKFGRALVESSERRNYAWAERYGKWIVIAAFLVGTVVQLAREPSRNSLLWFLGAASFAVLVVWFDGKTRIWERPLLGATLELNEVPLRLGGRLEAKLRLSTQPPQEGRPRLVLRSIRRTRRPGGGDSMDTTEDETLWQAARSLEPGDVSKDAEGHFIPVRFDIPLDRLPSFLSAKDGYARIKTLWTVELRAQPNDIPVECIFEIPVLGDPAADYGERLSSGF